MRYSCLFAVAIAAGIAISPVTAAADDHPELGGAVKAFHDTLSPNWHSPAGAARNAAACKNAGTYVSQAETIVKQATPSQADGRTWPQAALGLRDASTALGAYCASSHDANVVAGLSILHDRFHDLMKAVRPAGAE